MSRDETESGTAFFFYSKKESTMSRLVSPRSAVELSSPLASASMIRERGAWEETDPYLVL